MAATKAHIIAQLQREILPLQGFKPIANGVSVDAIPHEIKNAFPHQSFPTGAIHEFLCDNAAGSAATGGFIAGIAASLMRGGAAILWISATRTIFPLALKAFGIEPDKIIFIDLQREKDVLWAMEEALKCEGLAAVIGETSELDFTVSRRLQLAVEQSRVTGFILRRHSRNLRTTACIARWKISSLPSELADEMPGVGFPRWQVELIKIRNGKPGSWQIEWTNGKFRFIPALVNVIAPALQKKTG
jgi:protein ImuA